MRLSRTVLLFPIAALGACLDATEPARPTSVEVSAAALTGPAGIAVAPAPTFTVRDQHDEPMAGVPVGIAVVAGGGALAGAPTESAPGPAPVGAWTLGPRAGVNELELTVEGLAPVRITATGVPGPPEKLSPAATATLAGRVATAVDAPPRATLTDAFDNPIAGAPVAIAVSAGSAPATVTSAADGTVLVPEWILGTVRGEQTLTMTAGPAVATFTAFARPGPPSRIVVESGGGQAAPAGSLVPRPIRVSVRDAFDNPVDGVGVSFGVVEGAGSLEATSADTDPDGVATAPGWRLGRRAVPQRIRATAGGVAADVRATVETAFDLEVRFFGPAMSEERKAVFRQAVERLRATIVGDLPAISATNLDVSACGVSGTAPLSETIDDLIVFATVESIDGPGRVLASAGPCYVRSGGGLPVVGVMQFDAADVALMDQRGIFGDVVLHEMLHVVGVGVGLYWDPMLTGKDTPGVAYTGTGARRGCGDSGGATLCSASVPVENTGGAGTAGAHWRESVFGSELMTGYAGNGAMPLSRMTVGTLDDIGYRVNADAPDAYAVPRSGLSASFSGPGPRVLDRLIQPRFEIDGGGEARELGGPSSGEERREP